MDFGRSNNLSLKYQRFTPSLGKDKGIRQFYYVSKTRIIQIFEICFCCFCLCIFMLAKFVKCMLMCLNNNINKLALQILFYVPKKFLILHSIFFHCFKFFLFLRYSFFSSCFFIINLILSYFFCIFQYLFSIILYSSNILPYLFIFFYIILYSSIYS